MEKAPDPHNPESKSYEGGSPPHPKSERLRKQADFYEQKARDLRQSADILDETTDHIGNRDILEPLGNEQVESLQFGEQISKQLDLFEELGVLHRSPEHGKQLGYYDVTGSFRAVPNFLALMHELNKLFVCEGKTEEDQKFHNIRTVPILRAINRHGYDSIRLVPCGLPLSHLIDTAAAGDETNKLYQPFTILYNADLPDQNRIYYNPHALNDASHKGLTKAEMLDKPSATPGYQLILIQNKQATPEVEEGLQVSEYLSLAGHNYSDQLDGDLRQRSGMTPEMWLVDFMYHLYAKGETIDNYQKGQRPTLLLGSYLPHQRSKGGDVSVGEVPVAFWDEAERRFKLSAVVPRADLSSFMCRYAIDISKILTRFKNQKL